MSNEEKILEMLGEMQSDIKSLKSEVRSLKPYVETPQDAETRRKELMEVLKQLDDMPLTEEEREELDRISAAIAEKRKISSDDAGECVAS